MRTQRGAYFETQIKRLFEALGARGIHCHKNHARRTIDGVFVEGESFDYEIFAEPVHVFDAKETQGDRWPLSNAKPRQLKALLDCAAHGAEAYFLVLFNGKEIRRFDAGFVRDAMSYGRKSLEKSEGEEWDYRIFLKP
jgi:penicillin-binding protein-related factor A (putative recombinase)